MTVQLRVVGQTLGDSHPATSVDPEVTPVEKVVQVGAEQQAIGDPVRRRTVVRGNVRCLEHDLDIAVGDGASAAVRQDEPAPEVGLALAGSDLGESSPAPFREALRLGCPAVVEDARQVR
nr:hypothetical protein [Micromonospora sp. RTP1Z1]